MTRLPFGVLQRLSSKERQSFDIKHFNYVKLQKVNPCVGFNMTLPPKVFLKYEIMITKKNLLIHYFDYK